MEAGSALQLSHLRDILLRKSVRFGDFTLVSGQKSNVYVDSKLTTYSAQAIGLIGRAFLHTMRVRGWTPQAVGGLTLGADPIALAIARESAETGSPIDAFVVRKESKKHGTQRFIEGFEETQGLKVVVIDDVCSTGGSTAVAVQKAKEAGMIVLGAICLVDREMGAEELLMRDFQCPLAHIFKLSDLKAHADKS